MDFQPLTSQQVLDFCTVIKSSIKHEFIVSIPFKALLELQNDIYNYPQLEIKCELQSRLEFSPVQRNSIIVKTPYLTETTMFTYFIRIIEYNELNQIMGIEDILNNVILSYRCLEN